MEKILIDGYNLLYKDGVLKNLAERSLEEAREQLLASIATVCGPQTEVVVVFDGRAGDGKGVRIRHPGLRVIFSRFPQSADELNLNLVGKERRRAALIVVSSDKKDIGRAARAEGAKWVSSEAFIRRLNRSRRAEAPPREKPDNSSPLETEYWLRRFESEGKDPEE